MAWGSPAWLLPRAAVGWRARTLGMGCAATAGLGPTAPAARRALGRWPNQLLGLPGNAHMESAVQPIWILVLRSVDPAV